MNKRNCPVCSSAETTIIMKFTPNLLSEINPSYRLDVLKETMRDMEKLLAYSICKNCGMIYCENVWDDNTLSKVYGDVIDHLKSKDNMLSIQKRIAITHIWMNILRVLKLTGKEKLLEKLKIIDYGCGWGDFLDVVKSHGIDVMGYDQDASKIEHAKQRGHRIAINIEELKSFAPVDVIVMISVLEHLQDVEYYLKLTKRLLKPNGLFIFSTMDYRSRFIKRNIKRLKNKLPALTKDLNPIEHVNVYDYRSVMATLEKYDFHIVSTGHSLYVTDNFLMRNSMCALRMANWSEKILSYLIKGKCLTITVYALNGKN